MSYSAHHAVTNTRDELLFINRNIAKAFAIRVKGYVNLKRVPRTPQFSCTTLSIDILTTSLHQLSINCSLNKRPKNETSPAVLIQMFSFIASNLYNNHVKLFTDGSKSIHGVGSACYSQSSSKIASLPCIASIFSAEIYAISLAVTIIKHIPGRDFRYILLRSNSLFSICYFIFL